jgi:TolB-like protein
MDVSGVQGVQPGTATVLTNIVVADVARTGLDTVSKGDITAIIGFEKQKQILGCSGDAGCVAEIGGALGVDFMLTGPVGQIGSQYHVSLQLVETNKARVAARASRFAEKSEDALVRATREATAEVLAPAIARLPAGTARVVFSAAPAPAAKAGPSHRSAWIAYGIAGALVVGGGATGYVAKSRYDDLKAKQGTPGYAAAYASDRSSIRTTAIAADVMLGGGVVAAGVGTWLWFRSERAPIAVVPVVAPGTAAVAVAATF